MTYNEKYDFAVQLAIRCFPSTPHTQLWSLQWHVPPFSFIRHSAVESCFWVSVILSCSDCSTVEPACLHLCLDLKNIRHSCLALLAMANRQFYCFFKNRSQILPKRKDAARNHASLSCHLKPVRFSFLLDFKSCLNMDTIELCKTEGFSE